MDEYLSTHTEADREDAYSSDHGGSGNIHQRNEQRRRKKKVRRKRRVSVDIDQIGAVEQSGSEEHPSSDDNDGGTVGRPLVRVSSSRAYMLGFAEDIARAEVELLEHDSRKKIREVYQKSRALVVVVPVHTASCSTGQQSVPVVPRIVFPKAPPHIALASRHASRDESLLISTSAISPVRRAKDEDMSVNHEGTPSHIPISFLPDFSNGNTDSPNINHNQRHAEWNQTPHDGSVETAPYTRNLEGRPQSMRHEDVRTANTTLNIPQATTVLQRRGPIAPPADVYAFEDGDNRTAEYRGSPQRESISPSATESQSVQFNGVQSQSKPNGHHPQNPLPFTYHSSSIDLDLTRSNNNSVGRVHEPLGYNYPLLADLRRPISIVLNRMHRLKLLEGTLRADVEREAIEDFVAVLELFYEELKVVIAYAPPQPLLATYGSRVNSVTASPNVREQDVSPLPMPRPLPPPRPMPRTSSQRDTNYDISPYASLSRSHSSSSECGPSAVRTGAYSADGKNDFLVRSWKKRFPSNAGTVSRSRSRNRHSLLALSGGDTVLTLRVSPRQPRGDYHSSILGATVREDLSVAALDREMYRPSASEVIRRGDVISSIEGIHVMSLADLEEWERQLDGARDYYLTLIRGGNRKIHLHVAPEK